MATPTMPHNPAAGTKPKPGATGAAGENDDGGLPGRMGGILGLVAFAFSLFAGLVGAENGFATIVLRAVLAMIVTVVIGYLLGWVAQAMLNENVRAVAASQEKESEAGDLPKEPATDGR